MNQQFWDGQSDRFRKTQSVQFCHTDLQSAKAWEENMQNVGNLDCGVWTGQCTL